MVSHADESHANHSQHTPVSRRAFLTGMSTVAAGASMAHLTPARAAEQKSPTNDGKQPYKGSPKSSLAQSTVPFDGEHQAGIDTPQQSDLTLIAFTLRAGVKRKDLINLLTLWTEDARRLCAGKNPLGSLEPELTGAPANLTITCGFGPSLFDKLGMAEIRPAWLRPIKKFSEDQLDDAWGEADLVLQVCADDPISVSHSARHMVRAATQYAAVRWMQRGFISANGVLDKGETPRNLFGVKDGTVNPRSEADYSDVVWIDEGPDWARGGSVMVARRIFMNLDEWEILDRDSRAVVFGREIESGAPLGQKGEFDPADFEAVDETGLLVIDPNSHMAVAHRPGEEPAERILRRAYNYELAPEVGSEHTANVGLCFICYQKDPTTQFEVIQQRLNDSDRLNQWITHIGSAVFFCPPGTTEDSYWGQALLAAAGR